MAALITFKVDIDMKTGVPSKNLMTEARTFFKEKLGVDVKTTDEAIAEPKISEFVKKCIEETNKKSVSRAAHIRKFKLLPEDFSIPGGELTPTMKLKRKVTEKKYQKFVDEMFEVAPKLWTNIQNQNKQNKCETVWTLNCNWVDTPKFIL